MRTKRFIIIVGLLLICGPLTADEIQWQENTDYALPEGLRLYEGHRSDPALNAYYLDVDLNREDLTIRPYISSSRKLVTDFTNDAGAYAAINGGFFSGDISVSAVIYPIGRIKARNVSSVNREEVTGADEPYPVIRSLFSMDTTGVLSVDWIYHFDGTINGLYKFDQPLPYTYLDNDPLPAPAKEEGTLFAEVMLGIGGVPTLVKDSAVHVTYDEEILWGSAGYDNGDPRTAVGYTAQNHVILFVADGRQSQSAGLGLPEMAQILVDLGCVEAMNLDGGGSTQMAVGDQYVNSPSEVRGVPSILAVVHKDSLNLPKEPLIETVIDTGDPECRLYGSGWFQTANAGYWGDTPSMLNEKGDGSAYARFAVPVSTTAEYELQAWWVAAFNRCTDTPFITEHRNGVDTVYMDQSANNATWVPFGRFYFEKDDSAIVRITDGASDGTYIVADAIRLVANDTTATSIDREQQALQPARLVLRQNYPNPFNAGTVIELSVPKQMGTSPVKLRVFDTAGRLVKTLHEGKLAGGNVRFYWNGSNDYGEAAASGVYFCRLQAGKSTKSIKLLLLN